MSVSTIPTRRTPYSLNTLLARAESLMRIPRTVIIPELQVYNVTQCLTFPAPEVSIDQEKGTVSIQLTSTGDASSATSIASDIFYRSFNDMRKFNHDFTFAIFSDKTDEQMCKFFPRKYDQHDHVTPDIITRVADKIYVIEFATTRNSNNVVKSFQTKKFTYEGALKSRILDFEDDVFCFYGIIVVTSDRVCSNIPLSPELVNELCARFRCALSIITEVESLGMIFKEDTLGTLKQTIKSQLSSLDFKITDFEHGRTFNDDILFPKDSKILVAKRTAKYYEKCLLRAMTEINGKAFPSEFEKKESMAGKTDQDIIKAFKHEHDKINPRTDPKSVVKFPLIKLGGHRELPDCSSEPGAYAELWNDVIFNYRISGENYLDNEDLERIKDIALSDYDPDQDDGWKETRKHYHRVKVTLPDHVMVEFQKVGVEAKSQVNNPEVVMYREEKTKGIALETDTADIASFIFDFNAARRIGSTVSQDIVNGLLREALYNYGKVPLHGFEALYWITETVLYNWCQIVSDIGVELAISMKQHCTKSEFVFKQLRNHPVWLLIKPTNSESHIFVSIMIRNDSVDLEPEGHCFKTLMNFGTYSCTEFISFNEAKITNLVKTSSFFIAQVAQWARYFEVDYTNSELCPEAWAMIKLCLLVHLDDKHYTEEVMTLMRYVCMERFSSLSVISNLKMLDKIPMVCRSRLQAWATNILISEMLQPPYTQVEASGSDGREDRAPTWQGMRNPYLDCEIKNPQQLIELFYVGYAKNKDEMSNPNQDFKLVNKILKYEMKLEDTDKDLFGRKDITFVDHTNTPQPILSTDTAEDCVIRGGSEFLNLKHHEWAKSCVVHSADVLADHLRQLLGTNWRTALEENILSRLSSITWEEIATLKASSIFDPNENFNRDSKRIHTRREKVIIRVIQDLEDLGETPMSSLLTAVRKLEETGGLLIDIFKKNQHGGLREIYVLDLYSRLIQRAVEEIAKAYCSHLPSEVMMHPENKIRRPQQHLVSVAKSRDRYKKNISSSNDASVWNQGHHVLKFTQFMCRILPDWLKPFYQRAMQLWMTRKIKLPDGMINLLRERPDTKMWDGIDQAVMDAYTGKHPQPWLKASTNHLVIESGMMQGILHYTSSLFHASMLMARDNLFQRVAQRRGFIAMTCDMVSSDDSSRITDVTSNLMKMLRVAELYALLDHIAIKDFSKLYGIRLSPKSTICCNNVIEFNSEWLFRVNLIRPVLKWSFAALGMTEDESIYERQEVWNVQLTELLEGGSGFHQAHLTQLAQGVLHYLILGSSSNPIFELHAKQIRSIPDPSLGFFILDHPLATGLLGLSFSHWIVLTSSEEINTRAAYFLRNGEMTTTTKGIVTRGCVIRFGERKRAMKLIEQCEAKHPNWREEVEANPQVLYSVPRDKESSALKIMTKLTSPSVMSSLSKNSALTRIIASSVYIINRHAMTLSSAWLKAIASEDEYEKLKKTTLFKEATRVIKDTPMLSPEEMSLLFPSYREYELILEKLNMCNDGRLTSGGSRKSLRSHIPIITDGSAMPFKLEDMVRWKWFSEPLPSSPRILSICWEMCVKMIPWLRDTPQETLKESKAFESQIQLRNFIARQGPRTRMVHLTGAPVRDSSYGDMLVLAITKNQFPGKILVADIEKYNERVAQVADSIAHNLVCLQTFPCKNETKAFYARKVLISHKQVWSENMRLMNNRQSRLAILQYYCQMDKPDSSQVIKLFSKINDSRLGVVGGFVKRQERLDRPDASGSWWSGRGYWAGKIGDVLTNISVENGYVTFINTESIEKLREVQPVLAKFVHEAGLKIKDNTQFTGLFHFDGRTISPSNKGVPVKCVEGDLTTLQPRNLKLHFTYHDNSFRLIARQTSPNRGVDDGPGITMISFMPKSWDYQPSKSLPQDTFKNSVLFTCWNRNKALTSEQALKLLEDCKDKGRWPIDKESFDEFVKVSLISSLTTRGWCFDIDKALLDHFIPIDQQLDYDLLYGDEDLFGGADFDDLDTMVITEQAEDPGSATSPSGDGSQCFASLDWQDFELGLLDLVQSPISQVDIRRGHRLWTELVDKWTKETSTKDRGLLCRKQYTPRTKDIADVFSCYFGWTMVLHEEVPERPLSDIEEDAELYGMEMTEGDDDDLVIGGDEFWDQ